MNICIFCLKSPSDLTPWCKDNPGKGCTYGADHEYPVSPKEKPKQQQKPDKARCTKCSLHPKNPLSATNGCEHVYPE